MSEVFPAAEDVPTATAAQMAEVDRIASEELGIALAALMESASHQIARAVRMWCGGTVVGRDVVALCGPGNNGGDALAALRRLHGWGAGVRAVMATGAERLKPLARRQHDALVALGVETIDGADAAARHAIVGCDVLLDGLLGYSARGAPRGTVAALIGLTGDTRATIVAVDLPSGLDADTGTSAGAVVHAALTVTLALPKPGLASSEVVGTILLADIGIPPAAFARVGIDTAGLFAQGDILRVPPRQIIR